VAADVAPNSPPPGATIADIIALFATKFNLTAKDLAVLSGMLPTMHIAFEEAQFSQYNNYICTFPPRTSYYLRPKI